MKIGLWQQFAISSALNVAAALIATGKLSPAQKDMAADLISKGQAFLATFNR